MVNTIQNGGHSQSISKDFSNLSYEEFYAHFQESENPFKRSNQFKQPSLFAFFLSEFTLIRGTKTFWKNQFLNLILILVFLISIS